MSRVVARESVRAALDKVEHEILRDHLGHCVARAMGGGSKGERQRTIDELIAVPGSRGR